jgi:hypothetical protein
MIGLVLEDPLREEVTHARRPRPYVSVRTLHERDTSERKTGPHHLVLTLAPDDSDIVRVAA